nr:MAG TPA: hypothetical protein [Caudoviricetes sp.]
MGYIVKRTNVNSDKGIYYDSLTSFFKKLYPLNAFEIDLRDEKSLLYDKDEILYQADSYEKAIHLWMEAFREEKVYKRDRNCWDWWGYSFYKIDY